MGDLGPIPGLGRSSGKEKDYPLQYSGPVNSMNCMVHGVAKSRTQLSGFHFHFLSSEVGAGAMKCGVNCGDTPNTHTNMLTHKHAHTHTQGCLGVNSLAVRLCTSSLETLVPVGGNVSSLTLCHGCFLGGGKWPINNNPQSSLPPDLEPFYLLILQICL